MTESVSVSYGAGHGQHAAPDGLRQYGSHRHIGVRRQLGEGLGKTNRRAPWQMECVNWRARSHAGSEGGDHDRHRGQGNRDRPQEALENLGGHRRTDRDVGDLEGRQRVVIRGVDEKI